MLFMRTSLHLVECTSNKRELNMNPKNFVIAHSQSNIFKSQAKIRSMISKSLCGGSMELSLATRGLILTDCEISNDIPLTVIAVLLISL